MKKKALWSLLTLLFGTFMFYSCSTKDDVPQVGEDELVPVTFEFDGSKVFSKADPALTSACNDDDNGQTPVPLNIDLKLSTDDGVKIHTLVVKKFGSLYKTETPLFLPSKKHVVEEVIVYKAPNQIIYSGVKEPGEYAKFIESTYHMGTHNFIPKTHDKETITLHVLCARNEPAELFGLPKFHVHATEISCFPIIFNVCDRNREHQIGQGNIYVYQNKAAYENDKIAPNTSLNDYLYKDDFGAGNIGSICFPNDMDQPDNTLESVYIVIKLDNTDMISTQDEYAAEITVDQLLKWKNESHYDPYMNALHVVVCSDAWCIFCTPCDQTLDENFNRYTDINNFYQPYPIGSGWIRTTQPDVIAVRAENSADKFMLATSLADPTNDKAVYKWTTREFQVKNGHYLEFDYYLKTIDKALGMSFNGPKKAEADIVVNLIKSDGSIALSKVFDLTLEQECKDWQYIKSCKLPCTLDGCVRLEMIVKVKDGYTWKVCPLPTVQREFYFGFDNIRLVK